MAYDTIIFDCDGTLTDSEYLNNLANADLLAELGFPQYTVEYAMENFVGITMTEIKAIIEAKEGRPVPDTYIPDFIARIPEYQAKYLKPVDGAIEAVHILNRTYKTCVASNGEHGNVVSSIRSIGLMDAFGDERIFTKIQVPRGKPAPDLFLFAAKNLQSDPSTCIVIEDSPSGVTAGIAAGMHVIGFTGASHDPKGSAVKLQAAGAHIICTNWADILHYISSLTGAVQETDLPLANPRTGS